MISPHDGWPLTTPERSAQEIAELRRDLADALAVIRTRIAAWLLEHRLRLLEAAEVQHCERDTRSPRWPQPS